MQTMDKKSSPLPAPKGGRMQLGAMISNEDPNKWLKRLGVAVSGGAFLYWFLPQLNEVRQETQNLVTERQNLLGLILAGAGVALAAAGNEKGHVSFRDRAMGRNVAIGVGSLMGVVGGGMVVNNVYGELTGSDDSQQAGVEVPPAVSFVTGDTIAPGNTMVIENPTDPSCELILDFNTVPQATIDSGQYVQDAMRLQYLAYESGGYSQFGATGDFTDSEQFIDGQLGEQSAAAIAHLRAVEGLEPSTPSWGADMCVAIESLSDGNPNTPSFDQMPDLRFAGFQG